MRNLVSILLLSAISFGASAGPVTMQFTANGFGSGAPSDPVSGQFVWDAASSTSPINSLTSVNLTIAGHVYTLGEVGFMTPLDNVPSYFLIGGVVNGVRSASSGTNDFWIIWDKDLKTGVDFGYYSFPGSNSFRETQTFSSFSITEGIAAGSGVPAPGSLLLIAVGMAAFGIGRRGKAIRPKAARTA